MGKRYYCEYCDKTMNASPSIVKKHNNGLVHQKLVKDHYQQFKDPETILSEERTKKPCHRFMNGTCQFGTACHYGHYSKEEIDYLEQLVASKKSVTSTLQQPLFQDLYQQLQTEKSKTQVDEGSTALCDNNGVVHILPWVYNENFESVYGNKLPLSLKRFTLEDFNQIELVEWG